MSLIDDRHLCDECGGYRLAFKSGLSSACRCPDYHPAEPARHQIGAPVGYQSGPTVRLTRGGDRHG